MEREEILSQIVCQNRKFVAIMCALAGFNILLQSILMMYKEPFLIGVFVSITLFVCFVCFAGFLLGVAGAFLPYKGLKYSEKYLRASLLLMLCIEAFFTVGCIVSGVQRWVFDCPV